MLEVKNMTVQYGDLTIVDNVNFTVNNGQWLMIVDQMVQVKAPSSMLSRKV